KPVHEHAKTSAETFISTRRTPRANSFRRNPVTGGTGAACLPTPRGNMGLYLYGALRTGCQVATTKMIKLTGLVCGKVQRRTRSSSQFNFFQERAQVNSRYRSSPARSVTRSGTS